MLAEILEIKGFRRFKEARLLLGERIIALVGPNEAGKSALLDALRLIDDETPLPESDRSRANSSTEDVSLRLVYRLDEKDQEEVRKVPGKGLPIRLVVLKSSNGKLTRSLEPPLVRLRESRPRLTAALTAFWAHEAHSSLGKGKILRDGSSRRGRMVEDVSVEVSAALRRDPEDFSEDLFERLLDLREAITISTIRLSETLKQELLTAIDEFVEEEGSPAPTERAVELIRSRIPRIVAFDESSRTIKNEYSAEEINIKNKGLLNLLKLAQIDPRSLQAAMRSGDHGKRTHFEQTANAQLSARLKNSWQQFECIVHLRLDEQVLRVQVSAPGTYTPFSERSDGFRSFVALLAFVEQHAAAVKPLVLIDELESHLHYDAQIDLIRVLEEQEISQQVVYSTHSAAALPSDLGQGIRVVLPHRDGKRDLGTSEVRSSFWQSSPGFSPLLLALGASAFAATLGRHVVIAEGASDLLLLPRLFREASGAKAGFQVAPGLAEVSIKNAQDLELEAPRLAYLVDGDEGGADIKRKLVAGGLEAARVVELPATLVVEDFVSAERYCEAVNRELEQRGATVRIVASDVAGPNRPAQLKALLKKHGVEPPSKVSVARDILLAPSSARILDEGRSRDLLPALAALRAILKVG